MKAISVLIASLVLCMPRAGAHADDSIPHFGASLSLAPVKCLAIDEWERRWLKGDKAFSIAAEMLYSPLPADSCAYAADFGYPEFALGVQYDFDRGVTMHRSPDTAWGMAETVDYTSRMGNILTLYSTFSRPLLHSAHWDAGYTIGMGIGYSRTKYNPNDNADNELIGSRWLVNFTASLYATWYFSKRFGLRAGARFFHHSNGALNRPNKGANMLGPFVGIVYAPWHDCVERARRMPKAGAPETKTLYMNFTAGIGAKALNEDWMKTQYRTPPGEPRYRTGRFKLYPAWSLQTDVMYRYARRWASGIGFDMFCGTYAAHVAKIDEERGIDLKHDNFSCGIALKHEVFYRRISAAMEIGTYLYRHMGDDDNSVREGFPFYERIGIKYRFPSLAGMQIGLNVKAHKLKADFTELTVGIPIVLKTFL